MSLKEVLGEIPEVLHEKYIEEFKNTGSYISAWDAVKDSLTEVELVAATDETKRIKFLSVNCEFENKEIVSRTVDGKEYIDVVLTDNSILDNHGTKWSDDMLKQMADQINNGDESIMGDFDHAFFDSLAEKVQSVDALETVMRLKKGVAKAVKAFINGSKLVVRLVFDKRYRNHILRSKGVSLEGAFVRASDNKTFVSGKLLGFSFGVNKAPSNPNAQII